MADPTAPAPPKVHAPQRLDGATVSSATPAELTALPTGTQPYSSGGGAQVSAVVGARPGTPVSGTEVPTTATPAKTPVQLTELARTGGDVLLLFLFAVLALALGALLVRLGAPRSATPSEGAS